MKRYYEPLLKTYVSAFIEPDPVEAKRLAEKEIKDKTDLEFDSQAKTIDYITDKGECRQIMWFREKDLSLLAHELVHVIEFNFERRRIPFNLESTELIAYYMEHMFKKFEPLFKKKKKSRRRKANER